VDSRVRMRRNSAPCDDCAAQLAETRQELAQALAKIASLRNTTDCWSRRWTKLDTENRAMRQQLGIMRASSSEEDDEEESDDESDASDAEGSGPGAAAVLRLRGGAGAAGVVPVAPRASVGALPPGPGLAALHAPPLGPLPDPVRGPVAGAHFPLPIGFIPCDCTAAAGCGGGCSITGACAGLLEDEHACASNPDPNAGGFNDDDDNRLSVRHATASR